MNTRILTIAACLLTAAGLVGCASDQNAAPPPPAPTAAAAPAPAPAPSPPPAMPMGTQQQRVSALQTALNNNGAHLDVDGKMGSKTRAALKQFQVAHHLKVTGRADPATVKALGG